VTDLPNLPWIVRLDGVAVQTYADKSDADVHAARIGGEVWPDNYVMRNPGPKRQPWQEK